MSAPDQPDPLLGQLLSERYKVLDRIGEGGMGSVYLGQHVTLGKRVALKVLKPEMSNDRTTVERFLREAKATSSISHDNVVEIRDFGHTPTGSAYFVMELLEGQELADLMDEGPISWFRAQPILLQIAAGLAAAHERGIVHRDMKPGNIFLVRKGDDPDFVKVLDFGIAKVEDEAALTRAGLVFGTAAYMAPEQATAGTVDGRTDMYALACIAFEMLTGRLLFMERHPMKMLNAQIREPPPSLRSVAPDADTSEALDTTILRALEKLPDARFRDISSFRSALAAIPRGEAPAEQDGPSVESTVYLSEGLPKPSTEPVPEPVPEQPPEIPAELSPPTELPPRRPDEQTAPRSSGMPPVPGARRRGPPRPQARKIPMPGDPSPGPNPSPGGPHTAAMTAPPPAIEHELVPLPAYIEPLTFCFVALYRSVQGFLTNDHTRAIAGRLERWAAGASIPQLIPVVQRAISEYDTLPDRSARHHRLRQLNTDIAKAMPRERLAHVLSDLYEIASEDGRVREPELRLIVTTTQELGLTPDPQLLAIAYIYLTLAHVDGSLDQSEKEVVREQLRRWAPKASIAEVKAVIRWAVAEFKRRGSEAERLRCAFDSADQLRETVTRETQQTILADMWRLAGADGEISPEEQRFIMDIIRRFEA